MLFLLQTKKPKTNESGPAAIESEQWFSIL